MDALAKLHKLIDDLGAVRIRRGKHDVFRLPNGKTFSAVVRHKPSDSHSYANAVSQIRRLAEVPREPPKKASSSKKSRKTHPSTKKFLADFQPSSITTKTFKDEIAEKVLGRKPVQSSPAFTEHERPEELNTPRPPRRHHEPTTKSGPSRSLPPEVIAQANLMLQYGGETALRGFMEKLHPNPTIQHKEEDDDMAEEQTVQAARAQLATLQTEIKNDREQIGKLEEGIKMKESHLAAIQTFLDSFDLYSDASAKVKAVLLERNVKVPISIAHRTPAQSGGGRFEYITESLPLLRAAGSKGVSTPEIVAYLKEGRPQTNYQNVWSAFKLESEKNGEARVAKVGPRWYAKDAAPTHSMIHKAMAGD